MHPTAVELTTVVANVLAPVVRDFLPISALPIGPRIARYGSSPVLHVIPIQVVPPTPEKNK